MADDLEEDSKPFVSQTDIEHYDAAILFAEPDAEKALTIMDDLNKLEFQENEQPKICLYSDPVAAASVTEAGVEITKVCTLILVLATKNLHKATVATLIKDEAIGNTRLAKFCHPDLKYCVRPVYIEKERNYGPPSGLSTIQPINWYDKGTRHFQRSIKLLFENHLKYRKEREQKQLRQRRADGSIENNRNDDLDFLKPTEIEEPSTALDNKETNNYATTRPASIADVQSNEYSNNDDTSLHPQNSSDGTRARSVPQNGRFAVSLPETSHSRNTYGTSERSAHQATCDELLTEPASTIPQTSRTSSDGNSISISSSNNNNNNSKNNNNSSSNINSNNHSNNSSSSNNNNSNSNNSSSNNNNNNSNRCGSDGSTPGAMNGRELGESGSDEVVDGEQSASENNPRVIPKNEGNDIIESDLVEHDVEEDAANRNNSNVRDTMKNSTEMAKHGLSKVKQQLDSYQSLSDKEVDSTQQAKDKISPDINTDERQYVSKRNSPHTKRSQSDGSPQGEAAEAVEGDCDVSSSGSALSYRTSDESLSDNLLDKDQTHPKALEASKPEESRSHVMKYVGLPHSMAAKCAAPNEICSSHSQKEKLSAVVYKHSVVHYHTHYHGDAHGFPHRPGSSPVPPDARAQVSQPYEQGRLNFRANGPVNIVNCAHVQVGQNQLLLTSVSRDVESNITIDTPDTPRHISDIPPPAYSEEDPLRTESSVLSPPSRRSLSNQQTSPCRQNSEVIKSSLPVPSDPTTMSGMVSQDALESDVKKPLSEVCLSETESDKYDNDSSTLSSLPVADLGSGDDLREMLQASHVDGVKDVAEKTEGTSPKGDIESDGAPSQKSISSENFPSCRLFCRDTRRKNMLGFNMVTVGTFVDYGSGSDVD